MKLLNKEESMLSKKTIKQIKKIWHPDTVRLYIWANNGMEKNDNNMKILADDLNKYADLKLNHESLINDIKKAHDILDKLKIPRYSKQSENREYSIHYRLELLVKKLGK